MEGMEIVKELEDSIKTALKGLSSLERSESSVRNRVGELESKKSLLEKDCIALEEKRANLDNLFQQQNEAKYRDIEDRQREAIKHEAKLNELVSINASKQTLLDGATSAMNTERVRYEQLAEEYTTKLKEVNEKKARMDAAFNG